MSDDYSMMFVVVRLDASRARENLLGFLTMEAAIEEVERLEKRDRGYDLWHYEVKPFARLHFIQFGGMPQWGITPNAKSI
jgi:hypothetical protein